MPFTSSQWGSLASFGARAYPGTKKWYGTSGNSFVAVVEFGDSVRAQAVTAGGESGDPASKHFNDEAQRYATGNLRDVYFYPVAARRATPSGRTTRGSSRLLKKSEPFDAESQRDTERRGGLRLSLP